MKREDSLRGVVVNPETRELFGAEIIIENGLIKRIESRPEIKGPFILPGFIDSHVHIESSMLIPSRFAEMAVRQGTIAVVTDPHEVANVAGVSGINFMVENAKTVPMKFFFGVPSCVPASPLEKSGAVLDADMVNELLLQDDFYFLAEMMNFPGVIYDDSQVARKLQAARNVGKPVDGHAPGLMGGDLKKYVTSGISTDHECSTLEEAVEKIQLGMKILVREGSAAKNYKNLIPLIKNFPKEIMFCTDDCHPDYLEKGHINKIVSRAVKEGYDFFDVLYAATINPIIHYNIPAGRLREGDPADFAVVSDLENFDVISTYIGGKTVFDKGEIKFESQKSVIPSFKFRSPSPQLNLQVVCKSENMNVIGAIDGELITNWIVEKTPVNIGEIIEANPNEDLLKIVLLDRYSDAEPVVAFIRGFGLKQGALAASIAHDSHHILAIGCNDSSIESALNWIISQKGGLCFANNDSINGLALPYFGLMTNMSGQKVSEEYQKINEIVKSNGCTLSSPFMTASFMALTVIPELKIFHKGLFDGLKFEPVSLFK